MLLGSTGTKDALRAVGEILEANGEEFAIAIVGGAALNLLGVVDRATRDVDVLAMGDPPGVPAPPLREPNRELPGALSRAASLVAGDFGLESDWMNTGPALQWKQGLPEGLQDRVEWHRYAALRVGIVDRRDLIHLKLYAAADATGPSSVHYQDLVALNPTLEELQAAENWTRTQDPSPSFQTVMDQVVDHVKADTSSRRG